jgi:arylsulfatase A-like enzyme
MSYLAPLALFACTTSARVATPPDVFLFTIDTLRADHLEAYGYTRETAPWIASVAEDAVVFDAASATSSWTVPSVGSLLTGMMPSQLRIERAPSTPGPDDPRPKVPSTAITLAERLKAAGYSTFAVTANAQIAPEVGYDQGFDRYLNVGFAPASEVVAGARELSTAIEEAPSPVFVWIHLFDPHDPYVAREAEHKLVDEWSPLEGTYASGTMSELNARPDLKRPGFGLDQLIALYDAEIVATDQALEEIAGVVDADEEDVVIITADHGEEFRDHGALGHRVSLHEETVRVPLIVRWPGHWPARRVAERVSLASIPATIASLVGVPVGSGSGLAAGSILRLLEGGERGPAAPVVAQLVTSGHAEAYHAIYDGEDKLIVDVGRPDLSTYYQLAFDPKEKIDAARAEPARVVELGRRLDQFLSGLPLLRREWVEEPLESVECEQLRSMGYIDGCSTDEEVEHDPPNPPGAP